MSIPHPDSVTDYCWQLHHPDHDCILHPDSVFPYPAGADCAGRDKA